MKDHALAAAVEALSPQARRRGSLHALRAVVVRDGSDIAESHREGALVHAAASSFGRGRASGSAGCPRSAGGRTCSDASATAIQAGLLDALGRRAARGTSEIELGALASADKALLSSTLKEIVPIASLDGRALRSSPGPVTTRLMAAYRLRLLAVTGAA